MGKPFIICVDDDQTVLRSIREQLKPEFGTDYNIEVAESGHEAVGLCEEFLSARQEIPLVISDYIMPDMKGDELLQWVCRTSPRTVTVLLTGQATIRGVANAVNYGGVYQYIEKPWAKENLYGTVNKALHHYYQDRCQESLNRQLRQTNRHLRQAFEEKNTELYILQQLLATHDQIKTIRQMLDDVTLEINQSLDLVQNRLNPENDMPGLTNIINFYQKTASMFEDLKATRATHGNSTHNLEKIVAVDDEAILLFSPEEVLFFTVEEGNTVIVTVKGKYKVRESLSIMEERLIPEGFFRCHKGFLINLKHIRSIIPWIGTYIAKMEGSSAEIPISRSRYKAIKELLNI